MYFSKNLIISVNHLVVAITLGSFLLFSSCKKVTPTSAETIVALQQMQELATVEYTVQKVVKASDDKTWYKYGDLKILITCEAKVKAGIDFSALDTRYVSISGKDISIQMPEAKIISVQLPPEKINVAYQETGFFRTRFSVAEQNELMKQAETQVVAQANKLGILKEAENNTRQWLTGYLRNLGYEKIDLQFGSPFQLDPR